MRAIFRSVNEKIAALEEFSPFDGGGTFLCECGNEECLQSIRVPVAEYAAIRNHPRRFAIAPDHENPEVEVTVSQNGSFAVVETLRGEASRIAEETDPRHPTL